MAIDSRRRSPQRPHQEPSRARKWPWIAGAVCGGLLALLAVGSFLLYRASQQVPEFYRQALQVDPAVQKRASDEMVQKTTDLINNVKKKGHWEALFTDVQVNGWLAVELKKNHPEALSAAIRDPRVVIEPKQITLAFQLTQGQWNTVVSIGMEPSIPEPNVLALRIRKVRAGLVPLPMDRILAEISRAAERMDLRLEWRQADGDPVALLSLPAPRDKKDKLVRVESLRLGEGELYVSGTTSEP